VVTEAAFGPPFYCALQTREGILASKGHKAAVEPPTTKE